MRDQQEEATRNLTSAVSLFRRLGNRRRTAECLLIQARSLGSEGERAALVAQAAELSRQAGWNEGIERARRIAPA